MGTLVISSALTVACGSSDDDSGSNTGTTPGTAVPAAGTTGGLQDTTGGAAGATATGGDAACMSAFMAQGQSAECASCACSMCGTQAAALDALAPDQRALADAVIECGRSNCCSGTGCYCGTADVITCGTAMPATGPCVSQIDAAAGTTGLLGIAGPAADPTTALGAASGLGICLTGDSTMMVAGMCPACNPTCGP